MIRSTFARVLMSALFICPLSAAVSLSVVNDSILLAESEGPAKTAMEAFRAGRHAKAVELATPLAEKGNADALYLIGYAHETGQGADMSREKCLGFYRKAAATGHKDAAYRMSFVLLASDKPEERQEARKALENAAKDDPAVAGRILGEAHMRGSFSDKPDAAKAEFWWKQASDAGDVPSMQLLAALYEGQFGFPESRNLKEAMTFYAKAAGLGNPAAMAALGSRLLLGEESLRDVGKGREWIKKAIDAKEYSGYYALGNYEETVQKDLKAAIAEYERGNEVGQLECMLRLADFHLQGLGIAKNTERGLEILAKAAEGGSAAAHYRMAVHHLTGEKPELEPGYKHLLTAANANLIEAQNELGLFYLTGKLGAVDAPAGAAWITLAARGGHAPAQHNLAALYENGAAGLSRNLANAAELYSLAVKQGHGPATLALARLLSGVDGMKPDLVKAWALATLAVERGEAEASKLAGVIVDKLDDKQRAAAYNELSIMKYGTQKQAQAPEASGDEGR